MAEQWGRRWITIDTSRVALALARARIMGARYPYYILADSKDGQLKEAELSRRAPSEMPTYGNLRQGFVYERVPHITLRDIANNAEIDVIREEYEERLAPLRGRLSEASDQEELDTGDRPPATERRAAIFIGPEVGTVLRPDLVEAVRVAADGGFDVLIACAFNYDAHTTEFESLGRAPVLKARMNADLHMAGELRNTGSGNLFVIFGEPDILVAGGQWLVTSGTRVVANYDIVKELSGLGSLEEIYGVGRDGLWHLCEVSDGREVRYNRASATLSSVDSGEHSRGGGASGAEGIPEFSGDSQRLAGGDRDISAAGGSIENGSGGTGRASAGPGFRGGKDAQRTQTLAALQSLKTTGFRRSDDAVILYEIALSRTAVSLTSLASMPRLTGNRLG